MFWLPYASFQLRKWADVFVIAPLDANTMAKMALGMCDNLLVSKNVVIVFILKGLIL